MNKINLFVLIIEYFLVKVNNVDENLQLKGGVILIFDKIQKLCAERGISIYRLEKDLDFSHASVCKWKNSNPTVDKIKKVADYFQVPVTYFLEDAN